LYIYISLFGFLDHSGGEHVCKNIFGVLESLAHFHVGAFECVAEGVCTSAAFLVDVGDHTSLGAEYDLGVVLEVDLHDFVGEPEHNGVLGAHPLFDLDLAFRGGGLDELDVLVAAVQLALEVLQQRDFLVQVLGLVLDVLLLGVVVAFSGAALDLVEDFRVGFHDHFGRVVEEDSAGPIREQLAQALLGTVVHPLAHPDVGALADCLAPVVVEHVGVVDTHGQGPHALVALVLALVLVLVRLVFLVLGLPQSQGAVRVEKHFLVVV